MLKIISPNGQKFHQPSVEAFLDLLKVYQNFDLSNARRKNATFFIAEDNEYGVYGGAVLYPQKVCEATEDVLHDRYEDTFCGLFEDYHPEIQEFWIARIGFCLEANLSPDGLKGMELCEKFSKSLYEAFRAFGQSKETLFLAFSLCSFDTVDPSFYKEWPNNLPIKLSDDTDGSIHGILSLTKTKFLPKKPRKPYRKRSLIDQDKAEVTLQGSAA